MTLKKANAPSHLDWLVDTGTTLKTTCGTEVAVLELKHKVDAAVLSAWAKHFRNQYCDDATIDVLRGSTSRKDYLEQIKFPSKKGLLDRQSARETLPRFCWLTISNGE